MSLQEKAKKARLEDSKRLAQLVKNGIYEPPAFDAMGSWFPPRPIIKKDKKALDFIFDEDQKVNSSSVPG